MYQHVGIFCVEGRTFFAFYPTRNLKVAFYPTPTPDASQWNIGGVGSSGVGHVYFMYISCIFHVVCAIFSALATRKLADAYPVSSGIWALEYIDVQISWFSYSIPYGYVSITHLYNVH